MKLNKKGYIILTIISIIALIASISLVVSSLIFSKPAYLIIIITLFCCGWTYELIDDIFL